ncbi:S-layer homology domain-containing protein [Paenibacillus cymbidii]|uniref:S-layer homology domain-containing protein n=1 Tax=Paenibacillus cymbidii TaxID=1639034 RepID=UPI001081B67E|nr:S-layer homology domain-containing protein [Paenibacillus cymbidii]
MMKLFHRKVVLFLTILSLLASIWIPAASAEQAKDDRSGHWAEKQLMEWTAKGWLQGYADGSYRPDQTVSRAEYLAMMDRAFELQAGEVKPAFQDTQGGEWFETAVSHAVYAGILDGYEDGTLRPSQSISRQEAAVMLARLLKLEPGNRQAASFADAADIADWSMEATTELVHRDVLSGYPDGAFRPTHPITRAEAVTMLDKAVHLKPAEVVYSEKGAVYGSDDKVTTIAGDVVIDAPDITLKNTVIEGNLRISGQVGDGDVNLQSVTVRGETIVNGGGEHSVHFVNCIIAVVTIDKKDGTVRIVSEGNTTVVSVQINTSATLDTTQSSGGGFGQVTLSESLPAGSTVTLSGTFADVNVAAGQVILVVPEGSIGNLLFDEGASDSSVSLGKEVTVLTMLANAIIKAFGEGTITKVIFGEQAAGSELEVKTEEVQQKGSVSPSPSPTPSASPTASVPPSGAPGGGGPVGGGPTGGGGSTGGDTPSGGGSSTPPDDHTPPTFNATARSNTEVLLTFSESVLMTGSAAIAIALYSGTGTLAVTGITREASDKLVLHTASQTASTLYKIVTVTGITDNSGNAVDLARSTTYFAGKNKEMPPLATARAQQIDDKLLYIELTDGYDPSSLTAATLKITPSNGTEAAFTGAVKRAATAADAQKFGYKAEEATAAAGKGIVIDLRDSVEVPYKLYNVVLESLLSPGGSETWVSISFVYLLNTKPTIMNVQALDRQTLAVTFDRDVADLSIAGPLYQSSTGEIVPDLLQVSVGGATYAIPGEPYFGGMNAYKSPSEANRLILVASNPDAFAGASNTFELTTSGDVLKPEAAPLTFTGKDNTRKILVTGVVAVDPFTIQVYFDSPAKVDDLNQFAKIGTAADSYGSAPISLLNGAPVANTSSKIWSFRTSPTLATGTIYRLILYPTLSNSFLSDRSGYIQPDPGDGYFSFAGPPATMASLGTISVVATDARTIEVFYPEQMGNAVLVRNHYAITSDSDGSILVDPQPTWNVDYDPLMKKATLHLGQNLTAGRMYYLALSSSIMNADGTRAVPAEHTGMAGITSGKTIQFAGMSNLVGPKLIPPTVDTDKMGITFGFDQPVAIADSPYSLALNSDDQLANFEFPSGIAARNISFSRNDSILLFQVEGQLAGDSAVVDLQSVTGTVTRDPGGKTFHVRFTQALQGGTFAKITVINNSALKVFGKSMMPAASQTIYAGIPSN